MARLLPWSLGSLALLLLAGCGSPSNGSADTSPAGRIDHALAAAADYLMERQTPDGAWRSETYGTFKEGDALTPLVVQALGRTPPSQRRTMAFHKGADYLTAMVRPDGTIDPGPYGLTYPVYTAATAAVLLSESAKPQHRRARDAWLGYLRWQQLTEELGWQPGDGQYGGWGYAKDLPRKPAPGRPIPTLVEPNLSATAFAVEALRAAGCKADDPALTKSLVFIERCQNFEDKSTSEEAAFDDGGFFFIHGDAVRNKAGVAGTDRAGRQRYFSYGSTTADGLRGLLACGAARENPRVVAARQWLEKHFRAETHPGTYAPDRESARQAVYFYYCSSVARAFQAAGVKDVNWAEQLAEALLHRQRQDGSWVNATVEVREDDPLLATSLAIEALAICRDSIDGK